MRKLRNFDRISNFTRIDSKILPNYDNKTHETEPQTKHQHANYSSRVLFYDECAKEWHLTDNVVFVVFFFQEDTRITGIGAGRKSSKSKNDTLSDRGTRVN